MKDNCYNCGDGYKNLSMHWYMSDTCDYPPLTEYQKEVITGILMGDGCIANSGGNPRLTVGMTTEDYLIWLDRVLGNYGNGVSLYRTAEESAKDNRERGFRPNASKEDYNNVYRLDSRSSPEFRTYEKWYDSGKKVFPNDINLTPTVLKHWYVCDGTYHTSGYHKNINIAATNEEDRFNAINKWFEDIGFYPTFSSGKIRFSNGESEELFEYMGDPPPGFEYKWP